ncbi:MAG: hypothetical protein J7L47_11340 [Candidatus Odinarchaeota archaeon]|nr:hypothetical protein [Candidatus Odinarchaeota archaeon]
MRKDLRKSLYTVIMLVAIILFLSSAFVTRTYMEVYTNLNYSTDTPYRYLIDSSECRLNRYIVEVFPQKNGSLIVYLLLEYFVEHGNKSFGFKQFLPPTVYSYITNVKVRDEYNHTLESHVVKDHEYIEIGWKFYNPIGENKSITIYVKFEFVNAIEDLLTENKISLPNAGKFRIYVNHSLYIVHLPEGVSVINSLRGFNSNSSVYATSLYEDDPPEIYTTHFYSSAYEPYIYASLLIGLETSVFMIILDVYLTYVAPREFSDQIKVHDYPIGIYAGVLTQNMLSGQHYTRLFCMTATSMQGVKFLIVLLNPHSQEKNYIAMST